MGVAVSAQRLEKMQDAAVYLVEFDPETRAEVQALLSGLPWQVHSYETPRALLDSLPRSAWGCVVANVELADMTIGELLEALEDRQRMALILLCRDIEIPDAVAAMRAGVHDVLQFPVVERALGQQVSAAISKLSPDFRIRH